MRHAFLLAAALVAAPASAATVSIDFEGGTPGDSIGSFYAADGLTVANGSFGETAGRTGGSGTVDIRSTSGGVFFGESDAIVFTFADDVSFVAIDALDIGANGARIEAFDLSGTFLGADQVFGTSPNDDDIFAQLTLSFAGIREVRLFQPSTATPGDGLVFDDLLFDIADAVPAPAALTLFGLGTFAVATTRRRRRVPAAERLG